MISTFEMELGDGISIGLVDNGAFGSVTFWDIKEDKCLEVLIPVDAWAAFKTMFSRELFDGTLTL